MKKLLYILLFAIASLPLCADARLDSLFVEAVYSHDFDLMSQYAEQGANIDIRYRGYDHLMHYYASTEDIEGVKWCLNYHMDVNQLDSLGATPLMYAAIAGYSTLCKLLLDNKADTSIRSSYGMNASEYASHNCFTALSAYINNPSLSVPHDFYNYRREITIALRFANYKKAKTLGEEAIRFAHEELAPQSRYNVYLRLDVSNIYALEGDVEMQNKLLDEACVLAQQNVPMTEIYFRAKISQCLANFLQGRAIGMADSLIYYNSYSDEIFGSETKWLSFTAVALSAAKEGYVKEARTILYQALDYAISLARDDYEFYSDYVINTFSNILDLAVQADGSEALKDAEMSERYLRSFMSGRHDYITAIAKARIGHYYRAIGQYRHSLYWYEKSNDDLAKTVGVSHGFYAQNLLNIGTIKVYLGEVDSALVYFYQTKEILKRNQDYDSYSGAMTDLSIATCLTIQHMIDPDKYVLSQEVENLYLYALERLNKYIPSPDMNVAMGNSNLALYYSFTGEYNKAHKHATDATIIAERLLGKVNQTYLNISLNNIITEGKGKNINNLSYHISDFIKTATDLVHEQFLLLPEESRKELWENVYDNYFRRILPSAIYATIKDCPSLSLDLYNCALFSKGIILHTSSEIQSRLREMHNQEIDLYLDAIINSKRKINEYEQTHPGEYTEEWGQLVREIEEMEKTVLTLGRKYQDTLFLDKTSWKDIQGKLLSNQAAIEVLKFESDGLFELMDSIRYVAAIVTKDSEIPQYVYLFEESELIPLVNSSNKDNIYSFNRNGRQLSEMIWSKLLPYIGDAKTIYFSPDGMLCQLAVEALPLSADSVYGDAYDIVRCSSTKYILQQRKEDQPTFVDLFGGIQYDMTPTEMTNQSTAFAMRSAYRGEMPDSLTRGHYEELLGAKAEVNNIARLLNNANIKSNLFTGSNATEEEFKALSGTHPNVLHIATHGFFWRQEEAVRKDYFIASFLTNNKTSRYVSSMERAGLLFAGANVAMTGHRDELPSNVEDGVLSAQEISTMDLYGTNLVVLSACQTGQGDWGSDGVYGLQRAFKLAGVQTIIMSLWDAKDEATQMLMTEFYSNWIVNKMSKRKAFETAKQKVRVNYPEPSCWAGFIMLD